MGMMNKSNFKTQIYEKKMEFLSSGWKYYEEKKEIYEGNKVVTLVFKYAGYLSRVRAAEEI